MADNKGPIVSAANQGKSDLPCRTIEQPHASLSRRALQNGVLVVVNPG